MKTYNAIQTFPPKEHNIFELPLFPALYINIAFFLILDYPPFEVHVLSL